MLRRVLAVGGRQLTHRGGGHNQTRIQQAGLHASRPALAKILCADSIDPVIKEGEKEKSGGVRAKGYRQKEGRTRQVDVEQAVSGFGRMQWP
ncbi:hypothetical protein Naga_101832g1 [Nannochloropsis gaditana]|uniref:Uncharacterized protein n=1 Tax=Nannochloropsis gaditana TaxID=72520 RepID=W7TKD7_9STRA|nr:hypothetical protein Naga_101832g1 [Nannochloropsis gaditana]